MPENVVNAGVAAAPAAPAAAPKIARRGVASARGTQRLKFTHQNAQSNGLFLGHLESVDVSMIKIGEETTGMPSFNGLEIPKIRFIFNSNEDDVAKRKYVVLSFNAVESTRDTIIGGKDVWKVDNIFNWFNHILKVYVTKGRELEDVLPSPVLDSLYLPYNDVDENGEYVPIDSETVIAGWKAVFDAMENIMNRGKDGTPVYRTDGKYITIWMKLLRYIKSNKKGWTPITNGDLAFPSFVGEGCIEIWKNQQLPAIHINPINECITPKDIDKKTPKAPNMGMPGMSPMGGVTMDAGNPFGGFPEGGFGNPSDMPFDGVEEGGQF